MWGECGCGVHEGCMWDTCGVYVGWVRVGALIWVLCVVSALGLYSGAMHGARFRVMVGFLCGVLFNTA